MKKFFIFAVCALMSVAASAVNFGFADVARVAEAGNGFFAYTAGGEAVGISAYQYTQMKDADGWYILSVDGKKVIAAGDEFTVEKLTVDSVGLDGNLPKVFFTNGSHKVFQKTEWLKLLKGQTIRRAYLNTPTWEWENYATVDEGQVVVYHDKVAPTKRVTTTTAKPAATVALAQPKADSLPVAKTPAQKKTKAEKKHEATAQVAPAQKSTKGNGGISFRITH